MTNAANTYLAAPVLDDMAVLSMYAGQKAVKSRSEIEL
jgi:hypothetical protein